MDIKRLSNAASTAHMIKKQRSLTCNQNYSMKSLKSLTSSKISATVSNSHNSSIFTAFKPIESIQAITDHKAKLSKMYKSRLLPSQFLSTPASVLDKLTQDLYDFKKPKNLPENSLPGQFLSTQFQKLVPNSNYIIKKKAKSRNSHEFLDSSCKKMLQDNLESRKTLRMATMIMKKNSELNKELEKIGGKMKIGENNCFEKRLKQAHEHLVVNEKIRPKKRNSTMNGFFQAVDVRKSIG